MYLIYYVRSVGIKTSDGDVLFAFRMRR